MKRRLAALPLLLTAARLIDGTGSPPIRPGAVLIEGDRVVVVEVAGMFLHSFAYPLALLLAALFGVVGAASVLVKTSRELR